MNLKQELQSRVASHVERGMGMKLNSWELRELWRDVRPPRWWERLFRRKPKPEVPACEICTGTPAVRWTWIVDGEHMRSINLCGFHLREELEAVREGQR